MSRPSYTQLEKAAVDFKKGGEPTYHGLIMLTFRHYLEKMGPPKGGATGTSKGAETSKSRSQEVEASKSRHEEEWPMMKKAKEEKMTWHLRMVMAKGAKRSEPKKPVYMDTDYVEREED